MAYRSSAVLDGVAKVPVLASIDAELHARTADLAELRARAEDARRHAEDVTRSLDAEVARAEEDRRRALLLALASRPPSAEGEAIRSALRSERRQRDLVQALARARGDSQRPEPAPATPEPDVAQRRLTEAREERARVVSAALAAATAAEARVRELALEVDDLERERERLERSQP
jgi:hypothetical protein